ncbi:MAG: MBL fold metallo-hydrolase [Pseudonocardiaceae bacterium]|nr:MBL fold metallo-hydrolase [Pseudonocardiaceae bacterium]
MAVGCLVTGHLPRIRKRTTPCATGTEDMTTQTTRPVESNAAEARTATFTAKATTPGRRTELSPTVTHVQSTVWQCNCITIRRPDHAVVIDSCWNSHDIEAVRDSIGGTTTTLLITHADIDHVCSVGFFPDAHVVMSPEGAARLADGSASRDLAVEGAKWGLDLRPNLRVDQVVGPDERFTVGDLHVSTVGARGHAFDGLGLFIEEEGLFAVGDYLMKSQHPMVWWSLTEARRSTERLLAAVGRFDPRWVVPGHGPILTPQEAIAVGEADLTYLEEVERVADEAHHAGVSPREWHLAVESVPVPRPCAPDIEMLSPRLLNVAATFRDRGVDGELTWTLNMA